MIQKLTGDFTVVSNGSDTEAGVVQCVIAPDDTAALPDYPVPLVYDFQVKDSGGAVTTEATGTLTVTPDVTRAS